MSTVTLRIQKPFDPEEIEVEWVAVTSTAGSFVVGPNHRPLIGSLKREISVKYSTGGAEKEVPVSEAGGLIHVADNIVSLFLL